MPSDDASQLASPKIPKAGSLGPAKANGTWLAQYQPICLGIAELSPDGMARAAGLLRGACLHALTLNIWCRRRTSRSFHMQYSWWWLVPAKPSQIGAVHVFHLILKREDLARTVKNLT